MMQPSAIIDRMYHNDPFSQWLSIQRLEERSGYCRLSIVVRDEMCNGFGIAHGGISYSLCDSALAFASNAMGRKAVSIETSISHLSPVHSGDYLEAEATLRSATNRLAVFEVSVKNQSSILVALFKGTVYIKNEDWA